MYSISIDAYIEWDIKVDMFVITCTVSQCFWPLQETVDGFDPPGSFNRQAKSLNLRWKCQ